MQPIQESSSWRDDGDDTLWAIKKEVQDVLADNPLIIPFISPVTK